MYNKTNATLLTLIFTVLLIGPDSTLVIFKKVTHTVGSILIKSSESISVLEETSQ